MILVLEPIGGIAGDMCLSALLHLGVRLGRGAEVRAALDAGLAALVEAANAPDLAQVSVVTTEVEIAGIRALHTDVRVPEQPHHRPWRDVRALLGRSRLPEGARARALAAFSRLAEAEARIHGSSPDDVEFHEVGALDSIADVVGTALLIEALGASRVVCLPPPSGGGSGRSAHGVIPFPAPATVELLQGRVVRPSGPGERTTPTGAALATTCEEATTFPELAVQAAGYGAGTKRWDDAPNLLRAVLGTEVRGAAVAHGGGGAFQLEANLDDLSPQLVAAALEALLAAGALDAWVVPVVMKKGRPGHVLCALASQQTVEAVEAAYFRHTTTLGVRRLDVARSVLERELREVQTPYGPVRIKVGLRAGSIVQATPEYEDCAARASEHSVPIREVISAATTAFRSLR